MELGTTAFDWGNEMLDCLIQTFKFPDSLVHILIPGHFGQKPGISEAYGAKDLIFPLCVIDVTEKVAADPTYVVTSRILKNTKQIMVLFLTEHL